ncbi:syncollin-like [Hyperolius riggenbachi]|uniref:syncollin-like n=1 Tax=Hyperolius riggenbachi TaxID=752182 RepID=UPI0035A31022
MKLLCSVLLLPLFFEGLLAQCPAPAGLVNEQGEKLCARMYEHSNMYFDQSCNGKHFDVKDGDDVPYMPILWNNRASSLVVANRCTLKVWSVSGKGGNNRSFSSGVYYQLKDYINGLLGNWNDAISSYYCTCS